MIAVVDNPARSLVGTGLKKIETESPIIRSQDMPDVDADWWAAYVQRVDDAARAASG